MCNQGDDLRTNRLRDNHSQNSDHSYDQPHSVLEIQSGESNELGSHSET